MILSLPIELVDQIFNICFAQLSMSEEIWTSALALRLVCKFFDEACIRSLFGRAGTDQLSYTEPYWMSVELRTRIFHVNSLPTLHTPLAKLFADCADKLERASQHTSRPETQQYFVAAACQLAAIWTYPRLLPCYISARNETNAHLKAAVNIPSDVNAHILAAFTGHISLFPDDVFHADVNAGSPLFGTPLIAAALNGCVYSVTHLVKVGAGVDVEYDVYYHRGTPLVAAARHGHLHAVKTLLDNGASPVPTENQFKTDCNAISTAARYGHTEVVALLVKHIGSHPDAIKLYHQAMALAMRGQHSELAVSFLDLGLDPYAEIRNGDCVFVLAAIWGCNLVIERLSEMGHPADYLQPSTTRPLTPLTQALFSGHFSTARLLIKKGADVNFNMQAFGPPLHLATIKRNSEMVAFLLQHGADPNVKMRDGNQNALDLAESYGTPSIADMLRKAGGVRSDLEE